ncbi:MAG: PAS domain-containing sensor histidine kinase [Bacteroidetes bacterium]|nr:PAS domain-containing sensor histidine kinase [Bacteroidota bacterium]
MSTNDLRLLFFEEADVLFTIYDKNLNCIDVNKATLKLFNIERSDIIGRNIGELSPESISSGRYEAYLNVIKSGKTHIIDELRAFPNNQERCFRIKAFKLGTGLGIVSKNITDLETKIKETVGELKLQVKNLDDANKSINDMIKVLSNQNTQLNDFCGIISHNLRAPLINLSILSDFIAECNDPVKRELMFSKIKPVVNTLNETFNNLVESLQIREEVGLAYDKINFEELTNKIIEKHRIEIELYSAEIRYDFKPVEHIYYPKKYLDSILSNLVSNALKYSAVSRTPSIHIKTEMKDDKIRLKVIDNGSGIDLKKNGQHVFKMRKVFHDHPEAKGYGLFMTKTQVEAMNGEIFIESAPDQGTTFTIEFNPKNTVL